MSVSDNAPADDRLEVPLDGIASLPRRHVATIKSYLSMPRPESPLAMPATLPFRLDRLGFGDAARYRSIFATLGTRWLWWSRLSLTGADLGALLSDRALEAYAIHAGGEDIGLIELDFRDRNVADLAFLGLYEAETGKGYGATLMAFAKARVWSQPQITAMTVNTCTFDSPAALGFYRRHGFSVVLQAIEIVPDPRLAGLLPLDAAAHVPLLA